MSCNAARDEAGKAGSTVGEHWRPPLVFCLFLEAAHSGLEFTEIFWLLLTLGTCKYELTNQTEPGNGAGVCVPIPSRGTA